MNQMSGLKKKRQGGICGQDRQRTGTNGGKEQHEIMMRGGNTASNKLNTALDTDMGPLPYADANEIASCLKRGNPETDPNLGLLGTSEPAERLRPCSKIRIESTSKSITDGAYQTIPHQRTSPSYKAPGLVPYGSRKGIFSYEK